MKISGECHCGAITFEAELDPEQVGICHCSDCQTLSASAFRTIAIVNADQFRLTRGTPKEYIKTADSGNRRIQAFCPDCGTGLYAASAVGKPDRINLRTGAIKQRDMLVPVFECWTGSALPWLDGLSGTRKYPGNPA